MPEGQHTGRVAIVTGAARGIGRAIAERLLADGHRVAIVDRDGPAANAAAQALGERAQAITCDITDSAAVNAMVWRVHATWGRVDVLVNNAGIVGPNKSFAEVTDEEWASVLAINLTGTFNCCRAVVPQMMANDWGRIVNIASIAGKEGNPFLAAYSTTKAAVIGLTKSLGKELATTNIRVNCVTPAVIETEILAQMTQETIDYMVAKIPMGRPGKVTEVAALVAWLASDECAFSTGAVFDVSGGRATY
ncbi:MAG: SDR family oxidoreductase [Chloroflexota bacterium]|nr:SDR family oxidoreductase [Chloroflexota bacterium]MDQ6907753.1 SDR family oxidoreductase [Chloroflexota bacterium]